MPLNLYVSLLEILVENRPTIKFNFTFFIPPVYNLYKGKVLDKIDLKNLIFNVFFNFLILAQNTNLPFFGTPVQIFIILLYLYAWINM